MSQQMQGKGGTPPGKILMTGQLPTSMPNAPTNQIQNPMPPLSTPQPQIGKGALYKAMFNKGFF